MPPVIAKSTTPAPTISSLRSQGRPESWLRGVALSWSFDIPRRSASAAAIETTEIFFSPTTLSMSPWYVCRGFTKDGSCFWGASTGAASGLGGSGRVAVRSCSNNTPALMRLAESTDGASFLGRSTLLRSIWLAPVCFGWSSISGWGKSFADSKLWVGHLYREVDAALVVYLLYHNADFVPYCHRFRNLIDPKRGNLRHVHQALGILAGPHAHKRAKVHEPRYLAVVHLARLVLLNQRLYHLTGLPRRAALARNKYRAVVLDGYIVYLSYVADAVYGLAAPADNQAYLVRLDLDRNNLGRSGADDCARSGNLFLYHVQNLQARRLSPRKRLY